MDVGLVLYQTVYYFFNIVSLLITVRVILTWVPQWQNNQLAEIVFGITEPILAPVRRLLPSAGGWDFSPIVAFIVLIVLQQILLALVASAFGIYP